ncbi:orotidine-5'-phosphate decarboxylase [Halobacillus sp. B23F22_1]|uniref:orotidine-5'-phosphate decarboxylase n=1 Tax=Halobacillus sp. B23F22_1 TaxID=3459514 RepID=UPI00373F4EBB
MLTIKSVDFLYVALDFENKLQALDFLESNGLSGIPVKVGMELFYKEGPSVVHELKKRGHSIFLDLKLHDIPQTVRKAMKNLASLDVDVVNVHASGGSEMIAAARKGLEEGCVTDSRPVLLAVTQLTSTNQMMLREELLISHKLEDCVSHLAQLSQENGADGVVCSVKEIKQIKRRCGERFITVTPGIRRIEENHQDQKRVASPFDAGKDGTDAIVVGRSITQSKDPVSTYQQIKEEFKHGKH